MACRHCGTAIGLPQTADEEISLVNEQGAAAQALAVTSAGFAEVTAFGAAVRFTKLAGFWSGAYLPRTVPGLRMALAQCLAAAPVSTTTSADQVRPLIGALLNRAESLSASLISHPDATSTDKAAAESVVSAIRLRLSQARQASTRLWIVLGGVLAALLGIPLLLFAVVAVLFGLRSATDKGHETPVVSAATSSSVRASLDDEQAIVESSLKEKPHQERQRKPPREQSATPLQQIAATAVTPEEFDKRLQDNEWVFLSDERSCSPTEGKMFPVPGNEFEQRDAEQRRAEIRRQLEGSVVAFRAANTLTSVDSTSNTLDIHERFIASRGPYDFQKQRFILNVFSDFDRSWQSTARWPICATGRCKPIIKPNSQRVDFVNTYRIADLHFARRAESHLMYENYSQMAIPLEIPEETAKTLVARMPISILIVMRFLEAKVHKRCERNCMAIMGKTVCDFDNWGMGLYYEAELVGYEVAVDGKLVAEKQPTG